MSFSVSYVYKIIDKFTPKLRDIEKVTNSFNRSILNAEKKMRGLNEAMKEASPAARQAANAVKQATKTMDKTGMGRIAKFKKGLGGIQNKMDGIATSAGNVAASLGVGLGVKKAITDAIDYESSLSNVRRAIEFANENEFAAFQVSLEETGKKLAISKTAINELAATAGRLGIGKGEMADFATLAANMAIAFDDLTIEGATKSLAKLKTTMNLSAGQLKDTVDFINYLDDQTTASGSGLLEVMERMSGAFKTFKVPTNVAVGFAAIAEQLSPAGPEKAATDLRMFIQGMLDSNKFGKSVQEGLMTDFKGTIEKMLGKLRSLPEKTRAGVIVDLWGENAAPFIMSLVSSQEAYNKTMFAALDTTKALGSAEREAAKRRETAAFKLEEIKTALANMAIKIGESVLPALKEMAPVLTKLADDFGVFAKENPEFMKFAIIAAVALAAVAPLALAISGLAAAIGLIFSPLGLVIGLFTVLYAKSESFRESVLKIGRAMKNITLAATAGSFTKAKEYLLRDVNYEYDSSGAKVIPSDYSGLTGSAFQDFMSGQSLSAQKEMNVNIGGSIDLTGSGAAQVKKANLGSSIGGNLGFNIAGGK